jgi:hypothetical protein
MCASFPSNLSGARRVNSARNWLVVAPAAAVVIWSRRAPAIRERYRMAVGREVVITSAFHTERITRVMDIGSPETAIRRNVLPGRATRGPAVRIRSGAKVDEVSRLAVGRNSKQKQQD